MESWCFVRPVPGDRDLPETDARVRSAQLHWFAVRLRGGGRAPCSRCLHPRVQVHDGLGVGSEALRD